MRRPSEPSASTPPDGLMLVCTSEPSHEDASSAVASRSPWRTSRSQSPPWLAEPVTSSEAATSAPVRCDSAAMKAAPCVPWPASQP